MIFLVFRLNAFRSHILWYVIFKNGSKTFLHLPWSLESCADSLCGVSRHNINLILSFFKQITSLLWFQDISWIWPSFLIPVFLSRASNKNHILLPGHVTAGGFYQSRSFYLRALRESNQKVIVRLTRSIPAHSGCATLPWWHFFWASDGALSLRLKSNLGLSFMINCSLLFSFNTCLSFCNMLSCFLCLENEVLM